MKTVEEQYQLTGPLQQHSRQRLFYCLHCLLPVPVPPVGMKAQHFVQRTKTRKACNAQSNRQYHQHITPKTDYVTNDNQGDQHRCNNQPNEPVGLTHILSHFKRFGEQKG